MDARTTLAPLVLRRDDLLAAIDLYLSGDVPETRHTALWRACVAVYLSRLEDAEAALEDVEPGPWREVLTAEIELGRGLYDAGEERLERLTPPPELAARVAADLMRPAWGRSDWVELARRAECSARIARHYSEPTYEGTAYRARAVALSEGTGADEEPDLRRAVEILREAEDLRLRAYAETSLGGVLLGKGNVAEALALFDSAETTLLRLGLSWDVSNLQKARIVAELRAGDYEAALSRALAALPDDRAAGCAYTEAWALKWGSIAATHLGRHGEAVGLAEALMALQRLAGSGPDLVEAHVILGRARARAGDASGVGTLEAFLRAVNELGQPADFARARVLRADAWLGHDLPRAMAARDEAEPARALVCPWIAVELAELDRRWEREPVRSEGGRLVFDPSRGVLPRAIAETILDYYLTSEARAGAPSTTEAARRLGVDRRTFYKVRSAVEAQTWPGATRARSKR
jgi:tetratricopeptide (TPR) repeat protein